MMQNIIYLHHLCITVPRITVDINDADLNRIDAEAKQQKVSRSKFAAIAIDAHLHQKCSISDAEVMQLKNQVIQLQEKLDAKTQERDAQVQQIAEITDELDHAQEQRKNENKEATQRWEELKSIRNENTKLKRDLEAAQSTIQKLQADIHNKQNEMDQIGSLREELAVTKTERDKLLDSLKAKDEDVAFLRGHVSQLTQTVSQLSLPPCQEETRAKSWWQFWK